MRNPEEHLPVVLHIMDIAGMFGVTRQTVYDWRKAGLLDEITHYTPGGRPYFLADEVDAWSRSRSPADAPSVAVA
jgi:transposase